MIQRDEQGRVIALGGLTVKPTSHMLELDGRTRYSWCALDTLFLPELLGKSARVRSTCPQTGETIALTVDATGVHDIAPEHAVMSLHDAKGLELEDVIGTFCCYVHFFADEAAARAWTHQRPGTLSSRSPRASSTAACTTTVGSARHSPGRAATGDECHGEVRTLGTTRSPFVVLPSAAPVIRLSPLERGRSPTSPRADATNAAVAAVRRPRRAREA